MPADYDRVDRCPTHLLSDLPSQQDHFNSDTATGPHTRVTEALVELLSSDDVGGKTIGIEGSWGAGKTTVLRLAAERLKARGDLRIVTFDAWAHEGDPLERVVAWDMGNRQIAELGVQNVFSAFWWGDALATLGVGPAIGRGFRPEETARGDHVAVISHRIWQSRFASDPSVIGTPIHVNGVPYTVVGVMPPKVLIYGTDLWIPMPIGPDRFSRQRRQFQLLARLAPGSTLAAANRELETIARRVSQAHLAQFSEYEGWRLVAMTWTDVNVRTLRPAALLLLGAIGVVLLLVCANLANVLLARFASRGHEMAIRSALGAGRARLARQILVESVLLALGGCAVGLVLAVPAVRAVSEALARVPAPIPGDVAINVRVLLYTLGVSLIFAMFVGFASATRVARRDPQESLRWDGRTTTVQPSRLRLQNALVGLQVFLAVLLLVGGGLLVRSSLRLQHVDPGFDAERLLSMRLTLPSERYPGPRAGLFFNQIVARLSTLAGVSRAAAASQFPPNAFSRMQVDVDGSAPSNLDMLPSAFGTVASAGYLQTLGMPLLAGRWFSGDSAGTAAVAIVNETAARRFFGSLDAVGRRLRVRGDAAWTEVVGVVGDVRNRGLEQPPEPEVFMPLDQHPAATNQLFVLVRTTGEPAQLADSVRAAIADLDPDQPIYAVQTVDQAYAFAAGPRRMATWTLVTFAVFALALAAVGVYGVVAYGVAQRRQEIGVRVALGATRGGIRSLVVGRALVPVGIGLAAGLVGALALGRLMTSLLFEVSGRDPLTLATVAVTVVATATVASYLPALRASAIDPLTTLRME